MVHYLQSILAISFLFLIFFYIVLAAYNLGVLVDLNSFRLNFSFHFISLLLLFLLCEF